MINIYLQIRLFFPDNLVEQINIQGNTIRSISKSRPTTGVDCTRNTITMFPGQLIKNKNKMFPGQNPKHL